nr:ORF49 [Bracoviriform inaniti]
MLISWCLLVPQALMKPVMGYLRSQGWLSTIHLDDLLLFGESKTACKPNVKVTEELFSSLGLVINTKKSCLISRKVASFWGGRYLQSEFCWWESRIRTAVNPMRSSVLSRTIRSDALNSG